MNVFMKKIFPILSIGLSVLAFSALATSCVEEVPEVIDEMDLSRALTPSNTAATVSSADGHTVTFTWTNSNTATQYLLQVFKFETESAPATVEEITDEMLSDPYLEKSVAPSESGSSTSIALELDREFSYYARVCAQNTSETRQGDSRWAVFPYPIDTYTIMDPLAGFILTDRTSTTVSVEWTLAEDDEDGINQIRVSPNPEDASAAFKAYPVSAGQTSAVIDGLDPSTRYTVAAHFNSANRGTVYAWTRPDAEGAVQVKDTLELRQALREAADFATPPLKIQVAYNDGIPYEMGPMDIVGPVEIYGEQTVDGESPVIIGYFNMRSPGIDYTYTDYSDPAVPVENTISSILGATSLKAEALSFSGDNYDLGRNVTFAENFPAESLVSVSIVNCEIYGYSNGMFYDNSKTVNFDKIKYESVYVSDISGDGGDNFDIRAENTIGSIEMKNSTFTDGMRTFIRIDKAAVTSFTFRNNTVNNLCWIDNGNNKGLFNIRGTVAAFEIKDNIFLNLNGCESRTVMFPAQATAFPTTVSGNYYYNLTSAFFYDASLDKNIAAEEFPQSSAIAGGGAVLVDDPCYDSGRGVFNVTSPAVLAAEAGDPRWLAEYVEQPDPELVPVEYGYTWDLTDTDTFYDVIDKSCVRGNTQFIIASNPINVSADGFEFTAEPTFAYSKTPTDCAMAFLVDGPGSVVLSAVEDGSDNDHITVAYGPADGTSAKVAGAVYAGATRTRVVFPDFVQGESQLIYIYACGPIYLTELSWIADTETAGTSPLATPANLALTAASAGDETATVSLTWDEVANAASYKVKIAGPRLADKDSVTVTAAQYDFAPASMTTGIYTFTIQALKAEEDLSHEDSEVSEAVTFEKTETLSAVSSAVPTMWGNDDFQYLFETRSAEDKNTEVTADFVYNNLYYLNGGGKCKFGQDTNAAGEKAYRYQYGGTGNTGKQTLQFLASGNGTLTIEAASSGDSDRYLGVSVGETLIVEGTQLMVPSTKAVQIFNVPVTAQSGDRVSIYSLGSGINVFSITWTPEGYDPDAGIPYDPDAINEPFMADFGDAAKYSENGDGSDWAIETPVTIDKVTYHGGAGKAITFNSKSSRVKLGGSCGDTDDATGIPVEGTSRYVSFKVTMPGTITHKAVSSTSGTDGEGRVFMIVLATYSDGALLSSKILSQDVVVTSSSAAVDSTVEITKEDLAGSNQAAVVYFYSASSGINIYNLGFTPAQ